MLWLHASVEAVRGQPPLSNQPSSQLTISLCFSYRFVHSMRKEPHLTFKYFDWMCFCVEDMFFNISISESGSNSKYTEVKEDDKHSNDFSET